MKKYILATILLVLMLTGCQGSDKPGNSDETKNPYGEEMSKNDITKSVEDLNATTEKIQKTSKLINVDTDPLGDL